jgi:indole-3-glycerol phosphate synthase
MPKVKPPSGFLGKALERKRSEVYAARRARPRADVVAAARDQRPVRAWARPLAGPGTAVIAEVKRRSPSAGALAPELDAPGRGRLYAAHGAAAISVLTDSAFGGRLVDLSDVAAAVDVPVLRKDFLVDPWQIWESRAAGADAALVIVAALERSELEALAEEGAAAGLELLVEIHAPAEIDRALELGPQAIGVNARDLESLEIDVRAALDTLREIRRRAPGRVLVAESGIADPGDLRRARDAGANAVLVGEHLTRAGDPARALERLVAAGRDTP